MKKPNSTSAGVEAVSTSAIIATSRAANGARARGLISLNDQAHVGHHGNAGKGRHHQGNDADARHFEFIGVHDPDQTGNQGCRGRTGQADKPALVGHAEHGVEARQPQCGAGTVDERHHPAELAVVAQQPLAEPTRAGATPKLTMSDSESNSAPNALWLWVIRATRPSMPSSTMAMKIATAAVFELVVHALHHGVETGEQGGKGKEVGQQVDSLSRAAFSVVFRS